MSMSKLGNIKFSVNGILFNRRKRSWNRKTNSALDFAQASIIRTLKKHLFQILILKKEETRLKLKKNIVILIHFLTENKLMVASGVCNRFSSAKNTLIMSKKLRGTYTKDIKKGYHCQEQHHYGPNKVITRQRYWYHSGSSVKPINTILRTFGWLKSKSYHGWGTGCLFIQYRSRYFFIHDITKSIESKSTLTKLITYQDIGLSFCKHLVWALPKEYLLPYGLSLSLLSLAFYGWKNWQRDHGLKIGINYVSILAHEHGT